MSVRRGDKRSNCQLNSSKFCPTRSQLLPLLIVNEVPGQPSFIEDETNATPRSINKNLTQAGFLPILE